jgi:hypothetical protein
MIPSGLSFQGTIEFRCDRSDCIKRITSAKRLMLPASIIKSSNINLPFEEVLAWAIEECDGIPPATLPNIGHPTMAVVKVDETTDWLYSTDEITAFLIYGFMNYRAG